MKLRSRSGRSAQIIEDSVDTPAADPLGARLVELGELDADDVERIAEFQVRTGASFADAAVELGLLTPDSVSRAATEQAQTGLVRAGTEAVSPAVVAVFDPNDPLAAKLRALRSTLFPPEAMRGSGLRVLVLAGVDTDETPGVAANLAVLVAQLGYKGLLVDANFAAPTQHALFGAENVDGVTSLLAGRPADASVVATSAPHLDLLSTGPELTALSETAERVPLVAQLRALRLGHRFMIVDLGVQAPEMLAALARGADGALIVAERRRTSMLEMRSVLARLQANDVEVLGTILAR